MLGGREAEAVEERYETKTVAALVSARRASRWMEVLGGRTPRARRWVRVRGRRRSYAKPNTESQRDGR